MWVAWGWWRLFAFPLSIHYGVFVVPYEKLSFWTSSVESRILDIIGYFLYILVLLHIWWFYLISMMLWNVATKGVAKDLQNTVEIEGTSE